MRFSREMVSLILSTGTATVTFEKKDGTERVMHCTTDMELIPEEKHPIDDPAYSYSGVDKSKNAQIRAFDIDLGEWRSFILGNVKQIVVHS